MKQTLVLGVVAVVCGCHASAARPAPITVWADDGSPMTTVSFSDETSWPFELQRLTIVLDGEPLLHHTAPIGTDDRWAFEIPVENIGRGEHTVQLHVVARYASTRMDASDGCAVVWRGEMAFVAGAEPVGLRFAVNNVGVTRRFLNRLLVTADVAGVLGTTNADFHTSDRQLSSMRAACRDDGPLPFGEADLEASTYAAPRFP